MSAVFATTAARIMRTHAEEAEARAASLNAWIARSDQVLGGLEELNRDGAVELPSPARAELADLTRGLAALGGRPPLFDPGRKPVQAAIDYLFDELHEAAFELKWPGRARLVAEEVDGG